MAEVKIPIGPQHPALKEPERFMVTVEGETVVDADIKIGHIHRGIEKLAESRTYVQNQYLTERICGICSFTHTTNFCQVTEYVLGAPASAWTIPQNPGQRVRKDTQPPAVVGRCGSRDGL